MKRDAWIGVIALAGLAALLATLSWHAREEAPVGATDPAARSGALSTHEGPPLTDIPVTTVDIDIADSPEQPAGAVSSSVLISRFEGETRDRGWQRDATAIVREHLEKLLDMEIDPASIDCRSTLCRVQLVFDDPARRAQGVMRVLGEAGTNGSAIGLAVIERLGETRATLLVEPR